MSAVLLRARAGLRGRARSVVLLLLLLALAAGATLAAIAGSVRGGGALDRFVEASRLPTVEAFVNSALPPAEQVRLVDEVASTPGLERLTVGAAVIVALPGPEGVGGPGTDVIVGRAVIRGGYLDDLERPILVEGTLPLRTGQVAVNESLAERRGVAAGDRIDVGLFAPSELERLGNGQVPEPTVVEEVVVGAVVRLPQDLARDPAAQPGTIFEANDSRIVFHPSLWEEHGPDLAAYGIGLVAAPPEAAVGDVVSALQERGGGEVFAFPVASTEGSRLALVQRAIDLESDSLLGFAVILGVLTLALLGTALGRLTAEDEADRTSLGAIGFERRQIVAVQLVRAVALAAVAAVLAVAVAIVSSPLFPIGLGGRAEPSPGMHVDARVLLAGAVLLALLLVVRVGVGAALGARAPQGLSPRPARLPLALPAVPTVGIRMAVDGLRGRAGTSLRAAMAAAVCGVVAVVAAATFAASLGRLVDTPALQGWVWDVSVGNFSQAASADEARQRLAANPDVAAFAGYTSLLADVDGRPLWFLQLEEHPGQVAPVVLAGRPPSAEDEVGLGRGTLAELGKVVGDDVEIDAGAGARTFRIVAEVLAPAVLVPEADLDSGGVMLHSAGTQLLGGRQEDNVVNSFLVRLEPQGAAATDAIDRLRADFPDTLLEPMSATGVRDLERVRELPYLLAALLGALALGSVVVMLATVARRRRRDIAVLRAIGARQGQLRGLVAAQASTFSALALVVGLPLGTALGRSLWRLAADGVGSDVGPAVPVAAIAAAVLALLVAVNLAAQVPATSVVSARPGPDLRVE